MADSVQPMLAEDMVGFQPEGYVNPVAQALVGHLGNIVKGVATLPKELIDAAANSPGPGLRREDYTDVPGTAQPNDEMRQKALETAAALAGTGAPAAEAGAAGIFGGELSKTANLRNLDTAYTRAIQGHPMEDIRRDTGWFVHPADNKWRYEIPDNKSSIGHLPLTEGDMATGPAGAMFQHPELYKAYPELQDYRFSVTRDPKKSGWADPNSKEFFVGAPTMRDAREIGVHEMQHGVQGIEGFSPGTDPSFYAKILEKKERQDNPSAYDFEKIRSNANDAYLRTSGEVEARNAQNRRDYNPLERLMNSPLMEQFVDKSKQIAIDPVDRTLRVLRGY